MSPADEVSRVHPETLAAPLGAVLSQMAIGHSVSRALYLAAKLGLADLLTDGPQDAPQLASATRTHAPSLARVLRLLASVGVFEERRDGSFTLTPMGELLRADVPGSLRALVLLFAGIGVQDSWKDLEHCVRTGEPAFRRAAPGADVYTLSAGDPEATALFDRAMATFAPQTAAALIAAFDFSGFGAVADVGGGSGGLLIGILQAHPRLAGIVFDLPPAAERARQRVAAAGLGDRCQVVAGSFFDGVPRGADAYLLKDVLIDWDDERARAILKNCRSAIPPQGQLLIVEAVYPACIDQLAASRRAAATDVLMLVCTGGRQRSEVEFRDLLTASGFRLKRVVPTAARVCVIQGERT
jgi:hypothetical protein